MTVTVKKQNDFRIVQAANMIIRMEQARFIQQYWKSMRGGIAVRAEADYQLHLDYLIITA